MSVIQAGTDRVVAVLGRGVVPPATPVLRADDLGAVRGDGVFETVHVRGGQAFLLDPHLARMAASAQRLDLALPPRSELEELAGQALAAWSESVAGDHDEGALRLVCTRGPEAGGDVTVFVTIAPLPPTHARARRDGVTVATTSLGITVGARTAAPWLLGGAKTLSYAVNMAAQRWAQAHGVDDVLWISAEGYALEAPTSTLVWLAGSTLCTVPAQRTGILAGITARYLLDRAVDLGWTAAERMIKPAELGQTDGAWLTSSVRGLAEIRSIDGVERPPSPATAKVRDLLGYPI
jgi:4-amino-4-deoxychorismate lyase